MTPTHTPRIRTLARFLPGTSLAVIGSLLAFSGGGLLAAFGTDGQLASGPHLLSTPASAVVSPIASIKHTAGVATLTGHPTLRISATPVQGTARVFVGIGRAADVNRYLAGLSTEQVTNLDVDPYALTGTLHSGRANALPPTSQRFWVAQANSTHAAEINWKIRDGQYRVVIMNTNGQRGLATTTKIGITIPNIAAYSLTALLLGLLIAGGGTTLLIRASSQSRNEWNTPSQAPSAPAASTV
ncbi:MAG: hypothetical protein JO243_22975 [Solirubrobacterales bacterium]|nr:hypothetical protein [Solirubrobacterales bacterium]